MLFSISWWLVPLVLSATHRTLIFLVHIFIYSYSTFFKALYWSMLFMCHLQVTVPALESCFESIPQILVAIDFCFPYFCVLLSRINPFCRSWVWFDCFLSHPQPPIYIIRKPAAVTCHSTKGHNQWLWCCISNCPSFRRILMIFHTSITEQ